MAGQHLFNTLAGLVSPTPGLQLQLQAGRLPAPVPLTSYNSSNPISTFNATHVHFETTDNTSLLALLLSLVVRNMDVFKLMLIGGIIETSRRLVFAFWSQLWAWLSSSCCITVQFDSNDDVYHWMMLWLVNQSIWDSSRKMCITSARSQQGTVEYTLGTGNPKPFSDQQLKYLPTYESASWFKYKGTWISVKRRKSESSNTITPLYRPAETLIICWRHDLLRAILKEAKDLSRSKDVVNIYSAGIYDQWSRTSSRRKRQLRSVILEPEIKNGILSDAFDFLSNEEWYIDRGIPYRRGYLLYGVPGSGKTSLIHSIAGELGLDVYIVSLSKPGLDDSKLNQLFCAMPPRSILLIEDIDAVFRKVSTVRKAIAGTATLESNEGMLGDKENEPLGNVSLSGLLNALDGIAASEGRLLFATTNCITALDDALCRPGRMDVHVEFRNATKWQAKELFWSFFEPRNRKEKKKKNTEKDEKIASIGTTTPIRLSPTPEPVSLEELAQLSDRFADSIPADVFSVASLQGYLMLYKERPRSALKDITTWIEENLKKKRMKEKAADNNGNGTKARCKLEV